VSSAVVPPSRSADQPAAGPPRRVPGRRSLAAALLLGTAGSALVLLATDKTWSTGTAVSAGGQLPVAATGQAVTALPGALAFVGLAALVAVFAVRRMGRFAVSLLLTLCGAGIIAAAVTGAGDTSALDAAAAKASGLSGTTAQHVAHTGWAWAAFLGGALLLTAGMLAVARGTLWPAMSGRYERGTGPARQPQRSHRASDSARPEEMWKALDRGEDPTDCL
jgi:uncharacterized membrane protein (TIGR02234 family)